MRLIAEIPESAIVVGLVVIFVVALAAIVRFVVVSFSKKNPACEDCPSGCDACGKEDCALREIKERSRNRHSS